MSRRDRRVSDDLSPLPRGSATRVPSAPEPIRYSIADLEQETGISNRTIRYYISEGILPPAYGRGPTATYDPSHLLRLRMVAKMREEGLGLKEIREQLNAMDDDEIASRLKIRMRPVEDRWRRILLHPNLELHVREPGGDPDLALEDVVDLLIQMVQPVINQLDEK